MYTLLVTVLVLCSYSPSANTWAHLKKFTSVSPMRHSLCEGTSLHCKGKLWERKDNIQLFQELLLCACHHCDSKKQFSATSTNPSCVISLEHPLVPYLCWLILWNLLEVMTVKAPCAYFLASISPLGVRCAKQFSFSYFWSHQCLSINFWLCSFTWSCYV